MGMHVTLAFSGYRSQDEDFKESWKGLQQHLEHSSTKAFYV